MAEPEADAPVITYPTLNVKGNVKITEGGQEIRAGDLTVVAGKIFLGTAEVLAGGLIPDANGNVTLTGNLNVDGAKFINLGAVAIGVANNHLTIGGVEIWGTPVETDPVEPPTPP
jgi:hypothetical protein